MESAPAATANTTVRKMARRVGHGGARWQIGRRQNQSLQATPVGACLEVLSRRSGVPELGRSAAVPPRWFL